MMQDILKVLVTTEEISRGITALGRQISEDYSGKKIDDGQRFKGLDRIYG